MKNEFEGPLENLKGGRPVQQKNLKAGHQEDQWLDDKPASGEEWSPAGQFDIRTNITADKGQERERRLHLLAYDYWLEIGESMEMPDFRQLTPQGLSPYRSVSLLLDFSVATDEHPAEIRFAGDTISTILSELEEVSSTANLLSETEFGAGLLDFLINPEARLNPSEFDYSDEILAGRGIVLPLALGEQTGAFVWVVATFDLTEEEARTITIADDQVQFDSALDEELEAEIEAELDAIDALQNEADTAEAIDALSAQLALARASMEAAPLMGGGAREALYRTLAAAYELFEMSVDDPLAWTQLLADFGLRSQKRAPYTPALKLVFGMDHDKTRLTEYAAALAHAYRNDITSAGFVDWIDAFPSGIKGCVEQERQLKRGNAPQTRHTNLLERAQKSQSLYRLPEAMESDYSLALVRRTDEESGDIIALDAIKPNELARILARFKYEGIEG